MGPPCMRPPSGFPNTWSAVPMTMALLLKSAGQQAVSTLRPIGVELA